MRYTAVGIALWLFLLTGCQKGPGKVSGLVTRDGKPLPKAQLIFESVGPDGKPDPDKEAGGETDDEGRYTLERAQDHSTGILPGDYRVEVRLLERTREGYRELLPPQYNRQSQLKFTVPPGGSNDANFDVKSQ